MAVCGYNRDEIATLHLVKTYCIPTVLYGCESWILSDNAYRRLNVMWNLFAESLIVVGMKAYQVYCFILKRCLCHTILIKVKFCFGKSYRTVTILQLELLLLLIDTV